MLGIKIGSYLEIFAYISEIQRAVSLVKGNAFIKGLFFVAFKFS